MPLFFKKPKSYNQVWYEANKQRISDERKKRYKEDSEYRERTVEASRRYRSGERTPPVPADAPVSISEAAERVDVGISTLREWRRKKYFPEPKLHNRAPCFTENQVTLLGKRKECLQKYGKRRGPIKQ